MKPEDIISLANRAREFQHQCEARIYTVRVPTDHEMRILYMRSAGDPAERMLVARGMLELGIVAWSGVTLADLAEGQPPTPIPFDKMLVPLMLDRNENDFLELMRVTFEEYGKRSATLEADAKN